MHRRIASVVGSGALALALALAAAPAFAVSTPTSVTLTWTAPGDDSLSGTAALYDVRYATTPIDAASFGAAVAATGEPAPQVAGSTESMLVTGLSPATTYWFAIRTRDESGNWSAISNIVQWTTVSAEDGTRPAPLAIVLGATTTNSVTLAWNAVGDDSLAGTADHYEVRWSTSPITAANWTAATNVTSGVPVPAAPGTTQGCTATGLDRSVDLWFAVRVADEVNNWSQLSNVIAVPLLLDAAPPATPGGLVASREAGGVHVHWNANAEADLAGYRVYRALSEGGAFTQLDIALLTSPDYVDASVPDTLGVWYAVSAVDASDNESAHSAAVRLWLRGSSFTAVRVEPAYPNPSSMSEPVTLPVDVPAGGSADGRLDIVNAAGEHVRSLDLRGLAPGTNLLTWDGRNDAGRLAAPGVYRGVLRAGSVEQVVRFVRKP